MQSGFGVHLCAWQFFALIGKRRSICKKTALLFTNWRFRNCSAKIGRLAKYSAALLPIWLASGDGRCSTEVAHIPHSTECTFFSDTAIHRKCPVKSYFSFSLKIFDCKKSLISECRREIINQNPVFSSFRIIVCTLLRLALPVLLTLAISNPGRSWSALQDASWTASNRIASNGLEQSRIVSSRSETRWTTRFTCYRPYSVLGRAVCLNI